MHSATTSRQSCNYLRSESSNERVTLKSFWFIRVRHGTQQLWAHRFVLFGGYEGNFTQTAHLSLVKMDGIKVIRAKVCVGSE